MITNHAGETQTRQAVCNVIQCALAQFFALFQSISRPYWMLIQLTSLDIEKCVLWGQNRRENSNATRFDDGGVNVAFSRLRDQYKKVIMAGFGGK